MRAIGAALIAVGILYVVDLEFNDGRYATVLRRAMAVVVRDY